MKTMTMKTMTMIMKAMTMTMKGMVMAFMIMVMVFMVMVFMVMVMAFMIMVMAFMYYWSMVMAFMVAMLRSGNKSSYGFFVSFWSRFNQAAILIKIVGIADPRKCSARIFVFTSFLAFLC